jgi:hypothetical protein
MRWGGCWRGAAMLAVLATPTAAAELALEGFLGSARSFDSSLTLRESGLDPVRMDARWSTRPFQGSPYYAWRISLWSGRAAWQLQLVHHKLYLENPTPPVESFEVTHGYNLLTLGRAWAVSGWRLRVGAGAVVAHAESSFRSRAHTSG